MRDSTRAQRAETKTTPFGEVRFITLASGRRILFSDACRDFDSAMSGIYRSGSRMFKLANTTEGWDDLSLEVRVSRLEEYAAALRAEIGKRSQDATLRERIAALRDTSGRTPEEAALYLAKADELEARR